MRTFLDVFLKKKKSKKFYICARAVTVVERVGSEIKGMVF